MPSKIRKNAYYNDPSIGAAFDSLAGAFKPPSGSDMYGYAHAGSERAKAARLAELYDYAKSPTYDKATADRMSVLGGLYNPNQSYYSVDQNNNTSMRNTDANNRTTLSVADKNNAGALARQYAQPIIAGQDQTVNLPVQTAAATGLPAQFRGNISVNPGEKVTTPSGEVFQGNEKPRTDSEVKGSILAGLPDNEQRAVALQNVPVETVQRPDNTAEIVMRPDAVGRTPVLDEAKKPKPQLSNYKLPDAVDANGKPKPGYAGTAVFDDKVGWKDSQTGQPLPPGAVTYSATLQGDKSGTGLGPTTANTTGANKLDATLTSADLLVDDFTKLLNENAGIVGLPGAVKGAAQNLGALIGETTAAFGNLAPDAKVSLDAVRGITSRISPNYDPNIQRARMMMSEMAYTWAQMNNPTGEVSRQAYERSLNALNGGLLENNQSAIAGADAFKEAIARKRAEVQRLREPQAVSGPSGAPAAPAPAPGGPPAPAVERLRANPGEAAQFDAIFGAGAAARVLGGQ